jgi:HD-like signal output (HDOD) protein
VAHRFIGKPCDSGELSHVIERSLALGDLTKAERLRRAAVRATELPHVPDTHRRLTELLRDGGGSLQEATALVERDIATCGRVLQLANSAFFGRSREISSLPEAINYLGLRTLNALTIAAGAMSAFRVMPEPAGLSVAGLQARGAQVARVARHLVDDPRLQDDVVAAAMLHDIGLLVLAAEEPDHLREVLRIAREEGRPLADVEYETRGISHAEVGAHLLELWGLPHPLVEAVAYHHRPGRAPNPGLDAVTAVHVGIALVDECATGTPAEAGIEPGFMAAAGVAARLPGWRAAAVRELQ